MGVRNISESRLRRALGTILLQVGCGIVFHHLGMNMYLGILVVVLVGVGLELRK